MPVHITDYMYPRRHMHCHSHTIASGFWAQTSPSAESPRNQNPYRCRLGHEARICTQALNECGTKIDSVESHISLLKMHCFTYPAISPIRPFRISGHFTYPAISHIQPFHISGHFTYPAISHIRPFHISGHFTYPAISHIRPFHISSLGSVPSGPDK